MKRGFPHRLLYTFGRSLRGGGPPPVPAYHIYDTFSTDDAAPITNGRAAEPGPGTWLIESTGHYLSGGDLILSNVAWTDTDSVNEPLVFDTGTNLAWEHRLDASGNIMQYTQLADTPLKASAVQVLGSAILNQQHQNGYDGLGLVLDRTVYCTANGVQRFKLCALTPDAGGQVGGWMLLFDDMDGQGARVGFVTRCPLTQVARGGNVYVRVGNGTSYPTGAMTWIASKRRGHTEGIGRTQWENHGPFIHHDPFDGPGANLNGYVPYKGPAWTVHQGSWATDGSSFIRGTDGGVGGSIATIDCGRDMNIVIAGQIKAENANSNFGVVFRFVDVNNYQRVTYNWSSGTWYYNKVVAGVDTNLASWVDSINDGATWSYGRVRKFQLKLFTSAHEGGNKMQWWAEHQPDAYWRKTNTWVALDPAHAGTGTRVGVASFGTGYTYWHDFDVLPLKVSDWAQCGTTFGKITPDEEDGS